MDREIANLHARDMMNADYNESFDLDELEAKLESQLEEDKAAWQFLEEEKEAIGNPDKLGEAVQNIVWEQFRNQMAVIAGEDFIEANRGLTLDLSKEAHIQTTENFAKGKIATHNTEINYQKRHDDWQANFKRDEHGNIITHKTRSGREEATLVKGARKPYDEGRPRGSSATNMDMDHTISTGEINRDAAANAHLTKEEQVDFANSEKNLHEMKSAHNRSKGDTPMKEWLDNPNAKGQKPSEVFDDLTKDTEDKYRKDDEEAREEYDKQKKEGERRSIEAGKKSRRDEAFRIGGKALRAAVTTLLADLVKEIIAKLVKWFKSAKKSLDTLMNSLKEAIHSFVSNLKTYLINAGSVVHSTIVTAIIGPVWGVFKKVWMGLKQGFQILKDVVNYLRDPANKDKSMDIRLMEVGKLVVVGMTATGALLLGEYIEAGLSTIPVFLIEIPFLGSLANILGIFFGAVVAGILGAIVLNWIGKYIEKKLKRENTAARIDKGNEILNRQNQLMAVSQAKLEQAQRTTYQSMRERHEDLRKLREEAANDMRQSIKEIRANCARDIRVDETFDEIDALLEELKK